MRHPSRTNRLSAAFLRDPLLGCLTACMAGLIACAEQQPASGSAMTDTLPGAWVSVRTQVMADLPDSLLPVRVWTDQVEPPLSVPVLTAGRLMRPDGKPISPPRQTPLPALTDEDGQVIRDGAGRPFVLGQGGAGHFTTYTSEDGLVMDGISCSLLDSRGDIWFGTGGGGLSRYDGQSFVTFTAEHGLGNNAVWSLAEDRAGHIWIGTGGGGVTRYDGRSFVRFSTRQLLTEQEIHTLYAGRDGSIWLGTDGEGVVRLMPDTGGRFQATRFTVRDGLPNNHIQSLAEDASGMLLGSTNGIVRYDGQQFKPLEFPDRNTLRNISGIIQDQQGHLWFGTAGAGVYWYDGRQLRSFSQREGLAYAAVTCLLSDHMGRIWVGTEGGLSRITLPAGGGNQPEVVSFTTGEGLPSNLVTALSEDPAGNIWIGTEGSGIVRYDGDAFTNITAGQGLGDASIWSTTEDQNGHYWFSSVGDGVYRYDGQTLSSFTTEQGLPGDDVWTVTRTRAGHIWLGTSGGACRYDGKTLTSYTTRHGLPGSIVLCITEDRNGHLWLGTYTHGVCRYDGQSFRTYTTRQGLAGNDIRSIVEDRDGNIWLGTGRGVSRLDLDSTDTHEILAVHTFRTQPSADDNFIFNMAQDPGGHLWMSTDEGLSCLTPAQLDSMSSPASRLRIRTFTRADGLPDNFVTQVAVLPSVNKIIIGSNQGVSLFDIPDTNREALGQLQRLENLYPATGYPVRDINVGQRGIYADTRGFLWLTTGSDKTGLVRFAYQALRRSQAPPRVRLRALRLDEQAIPWHTLAPDTLLTRGADSLSTPAWVTAEVAALGQALTPSQRDTLRRRLAGVTFDSIPAFSPVPAGLVLPYRWNRVTFELGTQELARPWLVVYQYWLEGHSHDWSPVVTQTAVTFDNISEGTYTLLVRARFTGLSEADADTWSEPLRYTFTVRPPWWRSWWTYCLYGMIVLGMLLIIQRMLRQHILRREREQTQRREYEQAKTIEQAYAALTQTHQSLQDTQAQLVQAEKLASLGELTAGIAHEIQNPLNLVSNFSEINIEFLQELQTLLGQTPVSDPLSTELDTLLKDLLQNQERIHYHSKRASNIVKSMLEHARTSTGHKEWIDLAPLADEYLRLAYHGMRGRDARFYARMETQFAPDLPYVYAVPQDISRVLLNLISNAFYAVHEKNQQGIPGYEPLVIIRTAHLGDKVEIQIQDNGPGIPEAIRDKIFQPFFTTKPAGQGTGLGLSLSYDILKANGGTLRFETQTGEGATFVITFPVPGPQVQAPHDLL
ncbi:MAG: two-component regulator propeller domain-containing protein [Bacteroidia bacterium]|nr:two-component regulator propeller domain-containing protein [Bacteroidia bacterium]